MSWREVVLLMMAGMTVESCCCGSPCAGIGCESGVNIGLIPPLHDPGVYEFEVVSADVCCYRTVELVDWDTQPSSPDFDAQVNDGTAGAGTTPGTGGHSAGGSSGEASVARDCHCPTALVVEEYEPTIGLLYWMQWLPAQVTVTIRKDGGIVATGLLDLDYQTHSPSGDCGPTCLDGAATLEVP